MMYYHVLFLLNVSRSGWKASAKCLNSKLNVLTVTFAGDSSNNFTTLLRPRQLICPLLQNEQHCKPVMTGNIVSCCVFERETARLLATVGS